MSFRVCCPQCGAFCNVSDDYVGKAALCGNCDEPIIISNHSVPVANAAPQPSISDELTRDVRSRPLSAASARALTNPGGERTIKRRRWGCAVATITVLLAAVVFGPGLAVSFQQARQRTRCSSNLKQIALGMHNYHDTYGSFPPAYIADETGKPMHSWRVLILPFMEQQQLYDQYNFDEPWDGPNNRKLHSQMPNFYACPGTDCGHTVQTSYQVIVGRNTIFEPGRLVSRDDINWTSNTILVFDVASASVNWMEPRDITYNPQWSIPISLGRSNHGGKLMWAWADGSTSQLDKGISDAKMRSYIERSDGVSPVR